MKKPISNKQLKQAIENSMDAHLTNEDNLSTDCNDAWLNLYHCLLRLLEEGNEQDVKCIIGLLMPRNADQLEQFPFFKNNIPVG